MTEIELFDRHNLFMKTIIWVSEVSGPRSFLVINDNKGDICLSVIRHGPYPNSGIDIYYKARHSYPACYIVKETYV